EFTLLQNYPNPFNPATEIKYELPKNSFVTIKIYNALGEEIENVVNNEWKSTGRYSVLFDGTNFASGIYFYTIEAGNFKDTKKMILIK
ncbi:MAG: T9SS type A sorting domain-containing protein, partial [Chlorobi bacterium]|nr:T9SS type A sorting domain-containing protein [Chlorobiota bacterium]